MSNSREASGLQESGAFSPSSYPLTLTLSPLTRGDASPALLRRQLADDGLRGWAVARDNAGVLAGVDMGDEAAAVPDVDCIIRRVGDDHRAVVGFFGVDLVEVECDLGCGRGAYRQGRPRPGSGDRAVEMAGDESHDI